jgi:hypothetical protein
MNKIVTVLVAEDEKGIVHKDTLKVSKKEA